jgi:MFS family permease
MYIAGRELQGASAAAVWVVGLALVVDTVDTLKVGEYMGYVSWAMSFGALMGPILGGVVYDTAGYYVSRSKVPRHHSVLVEC